MNKLVSKKVTILAKSVEFNFHTHLKFHTKEFEGNLVEKQEEFISGTLTGIEPLFAVAYKRRYLKGDKNELGKRSS